MSSGPPIRVRHYSCNTKCSDKAFCVTYWLAFHRSTAQTRRHRHGDRTSMGNVFDAIMGEQLIEFFLRDLMTALP